MFVQQLASVSVGWYVNNLATVCIHLEKFAVATAMFEKLKGGHARSRLRFTQLPLAGTHVGCLESIRKKQTSSQEGYQGTVVHDPDCLPAISPV